MALALNSRLSVKFVTTTTKSFLEPHFAVKKKAEEIRDKEKPKEEEEEMEMEKSDDDDEEDGPLVICEDYDFVEEEDTTKP